MWKKIAAISILTLLNALIIILIVVFTEYIITFNRFNSFMTLENAIITLVVEVLAFVIITTLIFLAIFKWKIPKKKEYK